MWGEGVPAVIEQVKAEKYCKGIKWNDYIKEYPPEFLSALWIVVRRCALEWIDENAPDAFYRVLFTGESE